MNTKTISPSALAIINNYLHFQVGPASCSIPYFNNKTVLSRGALRVNVGKGTTEDIRDEVQALLVKSHVPADSLTNETLKKILAESNLGIDCSGFAYYILDAESIELQKKPLAKRISFINCHGLLGKARALMRPVENCDVATLAHDTNSDLVAIGDIQPGDIITLIGNTGDKSIPAGERDHILVIHQVEHQSSWPSILSYSHAIAYPEDGVYNTGIKQGTIEISDPSTSIVEATWSENGAQGDANRIFLRAKRSKTEVRRIRS